MNIASLWHLAGLHGVSACRWPLAFVRLAGVTGGATAIEYALLAAVVAITAVAALVGFGGESSSLWTSTGTALVKGMREAIN
ncbi:MAG: hypothetical protein H6851_00690 [Geminicoccaceae bacterium]|nr:hypothetical protein [Geminicoccaceae bacterium]MCB9942124.1 hypothetical protein [Geminicoccaceae bacterium]